jgi:uncharacterized protein YwbE
MKTTFSEVNSFIMNASSDQLKQINDTIRYKFEIERNKVKNQLRVGMKSKFKRKSGQITEGTITKINNKSIKLNCGVHGNWRVHPSFIIVD